MSKLQVVLKAYTRKTKMINLKLYFWILFAFWSGNILAQKPMCEISPKFTLMNGTYDLDHNISLSGLIDDDRDLLKDSKNSRFVVFHFFFDEENISKKTAENFLQLLKDSLQSLSTDIEVHFKIKKTKGNIIINDGGKSSAIHLNALIYSNDLNLLDELFGEGKQSRIDTSTTKLKKFNHEFIPIKSINKDNTDFLFSFRAKLKGKGFSCDPNEDLEIISHLKKIYLKKYSADCEKKSVKNIDKVETKGADEKIKEENDSLKNRIEELNKKINKYEKEMKKLPIWSLYSNLNREFVGFSEHSSFFDSDIKFTTNGFSMSSGFIYNLSDEFNGLFINSGISIGASNYSIKNNLSFEYTKQQEAYTSRNTLKDYSEDFKSTSIIIPIGIGYQFKPENLPIFFQFSGGLNLGVNKLNTSGATGEISYSRYYKNQENQEIIEVTDQPNLGLLSNIKINGNASYDPKNYILFGGFLNFKILYKFSDTSPLSSFINFSFNKIKSKTNSNGSAFISENINDHNSILNSIQSFNNSPLNIGLGIVYELRKIIEVK